MRTVIKGFVSEPSLHLPSHRLQQSDKDCYDNTSGAYRLKKSIAIAMT